jgi:hypothetical protein
VEFWLHRPDGDLGATDDDFEAALDVVVRGLRRTASDAAP